MSYLLKSSRDKKRSAFPFLVLVIFVVIVTLIAFIFPSFFPAVFTKIASPFWKGEHALTGAAASVLVTKDELVAENANLKNEIETMKSQGLDAGLLQSENDELKAMLGRTTEKNLVLGVILHKPPVSPYDILVIDVGQKEGITKGDRVLASGNIVIGEVAEVNGEISKVKLYSSPGEKYDIVIGTNNIPATATGRGGGNFETVLPRELKIAVGDTVTIPSISPLIFGTVGTLLGDPARPFETILFKNPVNISTLKWVEVVKK